MEEKAKPMAPRRPTTSFKGGVRTDEFGKAETKPPKLPLGAKPPVAKKPMPAKPSKYVNDEPLSAPAVPSRKPVAAAAASADGPPPLAPRTVPLVPALVSRSLDSTEAAPLPPRPAGRRPVPTLSTAGGEPALFAPAGAGAGAGEAEATYDEFHERQESELCGDDGGGYEKPDELTRGQSEYNTVDEGGEASEDYGPNEGIARPPLLAPPRGRPPMAIPGQEDPLPSPGLPPLPGRGLPAVLAVPVFKASPAIPDEDEDNVYEEVQSRSKKKAGLVPAPMPQEDDAVIYEIIDEAAAAAEGDAVPPSPGLGLPPPVPAPYAADKKQEGPPTVAGVGSPEPGGDGGKARKKYSFFGSAKGKSSKAKVQEDPPEYTDVMGEVTMEDPQLFTVTASAEPQPKYTSDLVFGLRDVVQIIRMDRCPVGKWVGRCNGEIGFVDCSNLHVDANALKDMMMNQAPVGVEASTVSAEGVPHNIGGGHNAKLGIKVSDSVKVTAKAGEPGRSSTELVPSILRKPKPDGAPPPPPAVAPFQGVGAAAEVGEEVYETMEDANVPATEPQSTYEAIEERAKPNAYEQMDTPAGPLPGLGAGQAALLGDAPAPGSTAVDAPPLKPRGAGAGGSTKSKMSAGQVALMRDLPGAEDAYGTLVHAVGDAEELVTEYENIHRDASEEYRNLEPAIGPPEESYQNLAGTDAEANPVVYSEMNHS